MARGGLPALAALDVADAPELWRELGFHVSQDGTCRVGEVELRLLGAQAGRGLLGWAMRARGTLPGELDGIPTTTLPAATAPAAPQTPHVNGATGIDHVVIRTPDLDRTLTALEAAGFELRRLRDAGPGLRQAFLWAGEILLEVAGPPEPSGQQPASLWGLVIVTPDLSLVGDALGSVRPAVQEGRLIATVRREAGSSVPLAFMTPHGARGT
jgi:catechol 2,3-dioxygenase-like lactoylglutathione lyase family enzyme